MNKLAREHSSTNEQMMREMNQVRQELQEMKSTLGKLSSRPSGGQRRGSILFGPRRTVTTPKAAEKAKPVFALEDLLPLLPHLSSTFPQLKNPKVADSIKVLSNPAVMSMIQQFLQNGGLSMLTGNKQVETVSRRERRGLFW
ncbi:hypothetical protein [Brevibacillus centrosporus]|jgi:hypothetical protein|uniref:Uncharacterized protein n=1 Tax=Brevibacillus centrosporus TaxID=54910 RepID=A0A1I3XYG4_9BACL|nr:hypothetical protein [Brevibacillus centrosporus]MEC2128714.1 hypothetical protein [Brevibacillus centrosporus]MED4910353.1 hypothetical protein [Brevibacillus centrosporus]RNB71421.1 hypothetical protein EDM55_08790 [Brevibacillus centrosporus]SFK24580.1 hypothetical protein SAMN05518846_110142 [Brevibacillus centrosporus]GED30462.1 hypothetical protein BCE02nite_16030 [Brevibacillus centrosporus]